MTQTLTKISLFLGLIILITSCDAVKNVPDKEYLLTQNTIIIDSTVSKDPKVNSLLFQHPNKKLLGVPFSLYFYNLANPQPDSTFQKWLHKKPNRENRMIKFYSKKQLDRIASNYIGFNKWIQKSGAPPSIVDEKKLKQTTRILEKYYSSFGWFNAEADYKIEYKENKRATVTYTIKKHTPYVIGSIIDSIKSPVVDSLFQKIKAESFIKEGKQYASNDFNSERDRINNNFRNSGLYYFDQSYINFEADSVGEAAHKNGEDKGFNALPLLRSS